LLVTAIGKHNYDTILSLLIFDLLNWLCNLSMAFSGNSIHTYSPLIIFSYHTKLQTCQTNFTPRLWSGWITQSLDMAGRLTKGYTYC
jgi:hypothetical protein